MVTPFNSADSASSFIQAAQEVQQQIDEQPIKAQIFVPVEQVDLCSPFFNPKTMTSPLLGSVKINHLENVFIGLEIKRLEQVSRGLELEELDRVIQAHIDLKVSAALKARVLLPQIIAQGPSIWSRLIPILKANPEEYKELFFWMIRSEVKLSINAADLQEIEGLIGDLANKHVKELIPGEFNVADVNTLCLQIIQWGRLFEPASVKLMLAKLDELEDSNDKATIFIIILLFCFPIDVEIPNYSWINDGEFEFFKPAIQEFQKLYNLGERINKRKLLSLINLKIPAIAKELYVKSKLASLSLEDLPAAAGLHSYHMLWYAMTNSLNNAPKQLPLHAIYPLLFNTISFPYLSEHYLNEVFGNEDYLKGFRENDLELIKQNVGSVLGTLNLDKIKKNPFHRVRCMIIFILFLEKWSLTYPQLKPSLKLFLSETNLSIAQYNLRRVDTTYQECLCLVKTWNGFICRQLGESAAISFGKDSASLKNNPDGCTYTSNPLLFAKMILNSYEDISALRKINEPLLFEIIYSEGFFDLVRLEKAYVQAFTLFLTLESPISLTEWVKEIIKIWTDTTPTTPESMTELNIVKVVLTHLHKTKPNTMLLQMTRPGGLVLELMKYLLEHKFFTVVELGTWIDNLLDQNNSGGDKSFWSNAYALMKKSVFGNRKVVNAFIPRWKKFEERILLAKEAPDETTQIVLQNQHQSANLPLSVAIQPKTAVKPIEVTSRSVDPVTSINKLKDRLGAFLSKPLEARVIAKLVLAFGTRIWPLILSVIDELPDADLEEILKTITIVRNYEHMIQPEGTTKERLDTFQAKLCNQSQIAKEIATPVSGGSSQSTFEANLTLIRVFGRIKSVDLLEQLYLEQKYDHDSLSEENAAILFSIRLIYTDCDESLLAALDKWELFFSETPLALHSHFHIFIQDVIELRNLARQGTGNGFMVKAKSRTNDVFSAVMNVIYSQLTPEDLRFIIKETDNMMVLRIVAIAINENFEKWDKNDLQVKLLISQASVKENLQFQIDSHIMTQYSGVDYRVIPEENPLEYVSQYCTFLLNQLKKPNCQERESVLSFLSILMRVIEIESLTKPEFQEYHAKILRTECSTLGLSISKLSVLNNVHFAIIVTWFRRFSTQPADLIDDFKLNTLSLSCMHLKEQKIATSWGAIAILKDFGMMPIWYEANHAKLIEIFTDPHFFDTLRKTDFTFPQFFEPGIAGATLYDSTAEIYLKHFKGEKQLESWLKKFVRLCMKTPSKITAQNRFEEIVEVMNQSDWSLDEMMNVTIPSPLFNVTLATACRSPQAVARVTRPKLLEWMGKILKHKEGDVNEWVAALGHLKTLKSKLKPFPGKDAGAKTKRFNEEFKTKTALFDQKIALLSQSDEVIAHNIEDKMKTIVAYICAEKELHRKRISALNIFYQNQLESCDPKITEEDELSALKTVIDQLNSKLAGVEDLFLTLLSECNDLFKKAISPTLFSDKLKNVEAWVLEVNTKVELVDKVETDSINNIKTEYIRKLQEFLRVTEIMKRKIELKAEINLPNAQDPYINAIATYNKSKDELKYQYFTAIDNAPKTSHEPLEEIKNNYDLRIAAVTTLFHKTMAEIAESDLSKTRSASPPNGPSRLKNKITALKEREEALKKRIVSLEDTIERQSEEISELRYLQYSPEKVVEKQLSARDALIINLDKLIEANNHVVEASSIKKYIQCEGKILTSLPEIFKVLELADFKIKNQVGNHRKFVNQFVKVTIFNHTNESYDIEILKTLEKLLETTEHWLKDSNH